MIKNYIGTKLVQSKKKWGLGISQSLKMGSLAIIAVFIVSFSFGQCITGGNSTQTVAYKSNVGSGTEGLAVDGNLTTTSAALNVPIAFGSAEIAINFTKPVNPGDTILVILGAQSGVNLSLFANLSATAYSQAATSSNASVGTPVGTNSASNLLSLLFIGGVPYQTLPVVVTNAASNAGAISIDIAATAFLSLGYTVDVYGVTVAPGRPTKTNITSCYGIPAVLTATKATATGNTTNIAWYTNPDTTVPGSRVYSSSFTATSGNNTNTSTYTTPALTTSTTYYVNQASAGCSNSSRTDTVTVTVLAPPTATLAGSNASTTLSTCGLVNGYVTFVDPANQTNKYIAINPNGNTGYNFTSATAINNNLSTTKTDNVNGTAVSRRLFTIVDGGTGGYTVNGGMKVRIYYLASDTTFTRSIVPAVSGTTLSNAWFKIPGAASSLPTALTSTGITGAIYLNSAATFGTEGSQLYVEFSGITSFSTFGFLAAKGSSAVVLPVTGITLSGKPVAGASQLSWTTLTEANSSYFAIESSTDGVNFTSIGTVTAAGNSSFALNYSFTDKNNTASVIYYRIKSVDKDGSFAFSNIVAVNVSAIASAAKIYPNPVTNLVNIETGAPGSYIAELFTVDGRKVTSTQIATASGLATLNIDRTNITSGIYLLKMTPKSGSISTYNTIMIK